MTQLNNLFVTILADYNDQNAFNRVQQELWHQIQQSKNPPKQLHINIQSVPAFDTLATAFQLAELSLNTKLAGGNDKHLFYVNTAPRFNRTDACTKNSGEPLVYAKLKNGVEILGVNSGHSFSHIAPFIIEFKALKIADRGSQFRSLHVFPQAVRQWIEEDATLYTENIDLATLPPLPEQPYVQFVDGYGNIKLSLTNQQLEELYGQTLQVTLAGTTHSILVNKGLFDNPNNQALSCYVGSSGWLLPNGKALRFAEIGKLWDSAAKHFTIEAISSNTPLTFKQDEQNTKHA